MKKNIHPTFHKDAVIVCNTCKTEYKLGSTLSEIKVELCANCHPFYTGKEMLVDTDNLVDKFNKKREQALTGVVRKSKKDRRIEKKQAQVSTGALTLKDMLSKLN